MAESLTPTAVDLRECQDSSPRPSLADRRSRPRYRFSTPITVHGAGTEPVPAITMEISENGLSALVGAEFRVGQQLELAPVGGGKAAAIVRRSVGRLCGFEFLGLSQEQVQNIRERCKTLPLYRGGTIGV
ncbi:MAG: PilZ domain-containing protein [Candidatus Sulfotelmatobacter sp.]